jgi:hypothetical protein
MSQEALLTGPQEKRGGVNMTLESLGDRKTSDPVLWL